MLKLLILIFIFYFLSLKTKIFFLMNNFKMPLKLFNF